MVSEEIFSRNLSYTTWGPTYLRMNGHHFLRVCCRNAYGLWFIWVYVLGTQKEAENYEYTIKITKENKVQRLLQIRQKQSKNHPTLTHFFVMGKCS